MNELYKNNFEYAYKEAAKGFAEGGIPIGAALFENDKLIATGRNERVQKNDAIAHGEISCLKNAGRRKSYRNTTLYTTLAPCSMCTGAILLFKIPTVIVGECETFSGEIELLRDRGVEVIILNDPRCIKLMKQFQTESAKIWAEDIAE